MAVASGRGEQGEDVTGELDLAQASGWSGRALPEAVEHLEERLCPVKLLLARAGHSPADQLRSDDLPHVEKVLDRFRRQGATWYPFRGRVRMSPSWSSRVRASLSGETPNPVSADSCFSVSRCPGGAGK